MSTLRQFAARMRNYSSKLSQPVNELAKDVALTIVHDLIHVTPVDTGAAVSNWIVQLNSPVGMPIRAYAIGMFGSTYSENISAALDAAQQVIATKQPGDRIFISNCVDYIEDLNNGSSRQAPANFVERAVMLGQAKIEKANFNVY